MKFKINRHGHRLHTSTWMEIYDSEFPLVMSVVDILLCIPPTSVRCETTFSQMKLIKTCRRSRMRGTTLSNLLVVKMESEEVQTFCPEDAVHIWMVSFNFYRIYGFKHYVINTNCVFVHSLSHIHVVMLSNVFFFQNQSVRRRKINYKRLKKDQEVEAEQRETETVQDQESDSEAEEENNLMEEIISYETSCGGGGMKGTNILRTTFQRK